MKTILSFILLSIIGLNCDTLYAQEPCKVLLKEVSVRYTGKCKNGLAHGVGVAIGKDKYEGGFKKGLPHGKGKYMWSTGEIYDGSWKFGKKEGEGKFYFNINGVDSVRIGIWKNDSYFKKITPKPYKVIRSNSIIRYAIHRNGSGSRVLFNFQQNGNPNPVMNIMFTPSSGSSYSLGILQGFENTTFPFICKVTYSTSNPLKTVIYSAEFEVEIREAGEWEVILYN